MPKSSTYSMLNVVATLDGQRIIGFWDGDDAITVTPGADIGTGLVGADGSSIFSQSANKSASISLKLQPTSAAHRLLSQKLALQRAGGKIVGFPFDVLELQSGEGGTAEQCFIQGAPEDSKGVNATVRDWTLWTGDWEPAIPNVS